MNIHIAGMLFYKSSKQGNEMANLQTVIKEAGLDITVNTNGQGFITRNGLCVLLGISRSTFSVSRFPKKLSQMLTVKGFEDVSRDFENGIPDIAVSVIVKYFAYHAQKISENAVLLDDAFSAIGIRTWFQQVAGYTKPVEQPQLNMLALCEAYIEAEKKIAALQPKAEAYDTIEKVVANRQGLKNIISTPVEEDNRVFTLAEYLAERQITLEKGVMVNFSRAVADSYKIHNGEKPATITKECYVRGMRRVGTTNVYQSKDTPVIREAMKFFGII
jgi:hypothetical protein